jgi:2-polyprenyl-3-methyl-5-hydroxy-6-metoxy-1,4-benzoquinol methylase
MTEKFQEKLVWETAWPDEGLEYLGACPICASQSRSIFHENLVDNTFYIAPGKWTMWRCYDCGNGYLDPRPNKETIDLAYSNYYTHHKTTGKDNYANLSILRKLRRQLVNGYTNWRYSARNKPSSIVGILAAFLIPNLKKVLDRQYRHLPKLPKYGGKLLDVGCGDGSFLKLAQTCGWDVVGIDPDPKAAANAAQQGLVVYKGDIEYFNGETELFDVITLSHVIEHVHEPVKLLKSCRALLKPGGQIWIETPNINSIGHARFKRYWRGLETPRHLVLFNRQSLQQILEGSGLSRVRNRTCPRTSMFKASFAIEQGCSPYEALTLPKLLLWQSLTANYASELVTSKREFLTVTALKDAT